MKKILALVLAFMMLFTFTAFADESAEKIIVGTNAEFAPFEFYDENGVIAGFDADLIKMIMTVLGYEYEMVSIDFDALLPGLASGQIDLAIAAMTVTEARKQEALFSDPYFNASQKIVVTTDSTIAGEADLAGKKVGVQLGTTGDIYVTEKYPDATVERYNKALDAVLDLQAGRLDAVVTDAEPAKVYAAPYENLKILDENLSEEVYGIAAAFGSEELVEKVNTALSAIISGDYYTELYALWFGEEAE